MGGWKDVEWAGLSLAMQLVAQKMAKALHPPAVAAAVVVGAEEMAAWLQGRTRRHSQQTSDQLQWPRLVCLRQAGVSAPLYEAGELA